MTRPNPEGFTDADAANRLRSRLAREMAAALNADEMDKARALMPAFRWLHAIAEEDDTP